MSGRVNDSIAEQLEAAGLWRRAATRWLAVMRHRHASDELEWLCRRRCYCFSKITPPVLCKPDFREIRLAADAALEQMEIARSGGTPVRLNVIKPGDGQLHPARS